MKMTEVEFRTELNNTYHWDGYVITNGTAQTVFYCMQTIKYNWLLHDSPNLSDIYKKKNTLKIHENSSYLQRTKCINGLRGHDLMNAGLIFKFSQAYHSITNAVTQWHHQKWCYCYCTSIEICQTSILIPYYLLYTFVSGHKSTNA